MSGMRVHSPWVACARSPQLEQAIDCCFLSYCWNVTTSSSLIPYSVSHKHSSKVRPQELLEGLNIQGNSKLWYMNIYSVFPAKHHY